MIQRLPDQTYTAGQALEETYATTLVAGTNDVDLPVHSSMLKAAPAWRSWFRGHYVGGYTPSFVEAVESSYAFREVKSGIPTAI